MQPRIASITKSGGLRSRSGYLSDITAGTYGYMGGKTGLSF